MGGEVLEMARMSEGYVGLILIVTLLLLLIVRMRAEL